MTETTLVNLVSTWGYFAIAAGMFLEGLTLPFPGAATVLLAGTLAVRSNLSLSMIAVCAALGYCLGTLIPYYLAKYGGRKLLFKYGRYIFLSTKTLQTAESWFDRYGNWVVCFGRPFFFGNYISYLAGLATMRLNTFLLYTLLGILPWSIVLSALGFYFGRAALSFW